MLTGEIVFADPRAAMFEGYEGFALGVQGRAGSTLEPASPERGFNEKDFVGLCDR
jgi:hypothetical protein